jgi:four helix bundle protein
MKENNLILDKSFDFALEIIELYKKIVEQKEYVLSKQILRSGTSIGANVEEAAGAHYTKDFLTKLIIAYKETRETKYWLRLFQRSQLVKFDFTGNIKHTEELLNILTAIIKTTKKNSGILSSFLFALIHYLTIKQSFLIFNS